MKYLILEMEYHMLFPTDLLDYSDTKIANFPFQRLIFTKPYLSKILRIVRSLQRSILHYMLLSIEN